MSLAAIKARYSRPESLFQQLKKVIAVSIQTIRQIVTTLLLSYEVSAKALYNGCFA
jgi:hypothetical protein